MKHLLSVTRHLVPILAVLALTGSSLGQELWEEFVHADNPHVLISGTPANFAIPPLIDDPNEVVTIPVLVVLLEFPDNQAQVFHTPTFFHDLVFGTGGGEWTNQWPSVKQIIETNSNGRVQIVEAQENDDSHGGAINDGIVGWVTAQCYPSDYTGGYCSGAEEQAQVEECVVGAEPDTCTDPRYCEPCDSWEYYRFNSKRKRAEAIRRADPFVNFASYDTMDVHWSNGSDGMVTSNELAVMVIHAAPDCQDHHGHDDWGTLPCLGGQCDLSDPSHVPVEGGAVDVYEYMGVLPEAQRSHGVAHEFYHQVFGADDLYNIPSDCNPKVFTSDGFVCASCGMDETACNDTCADAYCVADGETWEVETDNRGSTVGSSGTDETSCGTGDTQDVWFKYTPAVSGYVTISLCPTGLTSDFDTTLAVFDGCGGNQIACNDDYDCDMDGWDPDDILSELTVPMTAGTTYWIRLSGANGTEGAYQLSVKGGDGDCDYPRDSHWYPQLADYQSIMGKAETDLPHPSAWTKVHLGFVKPQVVTEDGTYTVYDAETDRTFAQQSSAPEALIVYDPQRTAPYAEYFILENRDIHVIKTDGTEAFDQGIALWHIHENPFPGDSNLEVLRGVRLIRPQFWADETGALWDGAAPDCYDFTSTSSPRNTAWTDGMPSYVDFLNISAAGPVMTVDIRLPGVFVDQANTGTEDGSPEHPYDTVVEAAVVVGNSGRNQTIRIAAGTYPESGWTIGFPCTLTTWGEGSVTIGQ